MTRKRDSDALASRRDFLISGAAVVATATLPTSAAPSTQGPTNARSTTMSNYFTVGKENSTPIDLYY